MSGIKMTFAYTCSVKDVYFILFIFIVYSIILLCLLVVYICALIDSLQ